MHSLRASSELIQDIEPYDPKSLPAEVFVSANESPFDVPAELRQEIARRIAWMSFNRYPDPMANKLRDAIAEHYHLERENVCMGNGGDELLFNVFLTWGGINRTLLNFPPTFSVYEANAHLTHTAVVNIERQGFDFHVDIDAAVERLSQGDIDMVVLTSPNNPTGGATPLDDIRRVLEASDALVVVDEAYGEFGGQSALELLPEYENLLILHTFSKAFSCAGVRLGYFLGSKKVISEFTKVRQPYSVDAISQVIGEEVIAHSNMFAENIALIKSERTRLMEGLEALSGVQVHPTDANFVLITLPDAHNVWSKLYDEYSILVRDVSGSIDESLRISVGSPAENDRVLSALNEILN